MQTIIGRITADAQVKTVNDGREVVEFSIAQNDYYKPRNSSEPKKMTNYFNCNYWVGSGIAPFLKKGVLVEVIGRVGLEVWNNKEGEARAALTLHVQQIQFHSKAPGVDEENAEDVPAETEISGSEAVPF